jgi:hypothetical protein
MADCVACLEPQHCACICSTCTAARRKWQEAFRPNYKFVFKTGKVTEIPVVKEDDK